MRYSETIIVQNHTFYGNICLDFFNERIRVDDYRGNVDDLHHFLIQQVKKENFKKVIVKGKEEDIHAFIRNGYTLEAIIPKYYRGSTAYFFTMYTDIHRRESGHWIHEDEILHKIYETRKEKKELTLAEGLQMRLATMGDTNALATLYKQIFKIYPTPLDKEEYIVHTMEHDTLYVVIENEQGQIVSAASAEIDVENGNAELTNCATIPSYRQYGLMKILLAGLEDYLRERSIYCAYTIARALSYGMNAAFFDLNYTYRGRLTKNCYIYETIEDMNVWTKDLGQ
ncbi:MAG: putative beta-lysine N-acetyltransferase [Bacillaceae bacterium]